MKHVVLTLLTCLSMAIIAAAVMPMWLKAVAVFALYPVFAEHLEAALKEGGEY